VRKIGKKTDWLKEPAVSRILYIISIIGIFYYAFMETGFFDNLPDIIKIIYYAAPLILAAIFGINIVVVKKLFEEIKKIFFDAKKTWESKATEMFDVAEKALIQGKWFLKKADESTSET
jgi:SNF family Na+-dependent transporter